MNPLIQALSSPNEAQRIYAIHDIGDSADSGLVSSLIERLEVEPSRVVKDAIVFQLKRMNCSEDYPILLRLLTSEDAYLRNAAVDILGKGGDHVVGFLTANLDHSHREVRKLILDALFLIGTMEAVLAIRAGLHDTAVNVKITAVEYLGRLEDRESVPELIGLLEDDPEPMLVTSVLESLSFLASAPEILKILATLIPEGDIRRAEPLYLPEILRMTARAADQDTVMRMIDSIPDVKSYAHEVLAMLDEAKQRFAGFTTHERVLGKMLELVLDSEVNELVRHAGCEHLLEKGILNPGQMSFIGQALLAEETMSYTAVRFLAGSGMSADMEKLQAVQEATEDVQLRALCEEIRGLERDECLQGKSDVKRG